MVVQLHPEALAEYTEAVGFYEERAPGLGREFFDEVQRVLRVIEESPKLGSPFDGPYRRAHCRRFPFGVVYHERRAATDVLAVMHLRRRPKMLEGASVTGVEPASNNVVAASARFARSRVHGA